MEKTNQDKHCDVSIRIGGQAGQGMKVISSLLGKTFTRQGLWVFTNHDIMSRIRGGHNFSQIRLSDQPIRTLSARVDILICLDENTLSLYRDEISGLIIYDQGKVKRRPRAGRKFLPVPLEEIAKETGGNPKMANSVASGAVFALLDLPLDELKALLEETFKDKGSGVYKANKDCAQAGYDFVKKNYKGDAFCPLKVSSSPQRRMLVTGSEAIALGALASNIRFYCGYPMSPSTPIMEYLASKQKEFGLIVEQTEDEISAINMAVGAFFCGARSMVATSGGGLALMVEGISLAGMTETPVVIADCQRPAPATGLPTRTEQADLLYVAHSGHGEFPRAVLAPSSAEEAFLLTSKAFYLAEKYQTPVFILCDQYFNDSSWTVESFPVERTFDHKQSLLPAEELKKLSPYSYSRYEITDSGISPRIFPGTPHQVLYADSDEHTVEGHITESAEVRKDMVDKRLRKLNGLKQEMSPPQIYPDKKAREYVVSWGSTRAVVEEAVRILREKGRNTGYIHFSEVFPLKKNAFPAEIAKNSRLIAAENNATGQFAKLLKMETGLEIKHKILKYDGRPFSSQDLAAQIQKLGRK
ncbi:MAG: 2-oxoacid:acceptor oxidoreductase subunit alpha [Candidatus Aminicenantes bacterium]